MSEVLVKSEGLAAPQKRVSIHFVEEQRLMKEAVLDALRDHKQAGNPVAIWEDGKVKIVPPEEIVLPEA